MSVVLILAAFFLFFFLAQKFEHDETVKAVQRQINSEIKKGEAVRLSNGKVVSTEGMNVEYKKLTVEFLYLNSRGIHIPNLSNLSFEDLVDQYQKEKRVEKKEIEQKRLQQELERQAREERELERIRLEEEQKKKEKWTKVFSCCHSIEYEKKDHFPGVYLIHSQQTNDFYIGSSKDLIRRRYQHFYSLKNKKHFSYKMQEHYNQFGINNFNFYLLEKMSEGTKDLQYLLESREQDFIDLLEPTYNYFMNVKEGKRYYYQKGNNCNY